MTMIAAPDMTKSAVCHEPGTPSTVRTRMTSAPSPITAISLDIPEV